MSKNRVQEQEYINSLINTTGGHRITGDTLREVLIDMTKNMSFPEDLDIAFDIDTFHFEVVKALPETGSLNAIYLKGPIGKNDDKYEEWIYDPSKPEWIKIGSAGIDLSEYVTFSDLNDALEDYTISVDNPLVPGSKKNSIQQQETGAAASGKGSTAFGKDTVASGDYSFAEGVQNSVAGLGSHGEGGNNTTTNDFEHAQGKWNKSIPGYSIHTVGVGEKDTRKNAHVITTDGKHYIPGIGGYKGTESVLPLNGDLASIINNKQDSLISGKNIKTINNNPITGEGNLSLVTDNELAIEKTASNSIQQKGTGVRAIGLNSTALGQGDSSNDLVFDGPVSDCTYEVSNRDDLRIGDIFIKGNTPVKIIDIKGNTVAFDKSIGRVNGEHLIRVRGAASGEGAFVEGGFNIASGDVSHAEGSESIASGLSSHSEGIHTSADGAGSHSEGIRTRAIGDGSHVEGSESIASGLHSHSEGQYSQSIGENTHAEGKHAVAHGNNSHAEGESTNAKGISSHVEGVGTQTENIGEHADGVYNVSIPGVTQHTVGVGNASERKNAHTITVDGKHYVLGVGGYEGTERSLSEGGDLASVLDNKAPKNHISKKGEYGLADNINYGHVKIIGGDLSNMVYSNGSAAAAAHSHDQYAPIQADFSPLIDPSQWSNITLNHTITVPNQYMMAVIGDRATKALMNGTIGEAGCWAKFGSYIEGFLSRCGEKMYEIIVFNSSPEILSHFMIRVSYDQRSDNWIIYIQRLAW